MRKEYESKTKNRRERWEWRWAVEFIANFGRKLTFFTTNSTAKTEPPTANEYEITGDRPRKTTVGTAAVFPYTVVIVEFEAADDVAGVGEAAA
jgi:hypothetical protein